jgi:hypothetical protein
MVRPASRDVVQQGLAMASWEAVMVSHDPQPALTPAGAGSGMRPLDWRQQLATLRVGQRMFGQCLGARACAWLTRTVTVAFAWGLLYPAFFLPLSRDAFLRGALIAFSACAGLAALSAAGSGPDRLLDAGRGLLENRGLALARFERERPLVVGLWIVQELGVLLAVLVGAGLVGARGPQILHWLGLGLGALLYLIALGVGLALLGQLAHLLGRARGQALLLALVCVPQLLAPAWPGLPTVASSYGTLLNLCLRQKGLP